MTEERDRLSNELGKASDSRPSVTDWLLEKQKLLRDITEKSTKISQLERQVA